LFARIEALTKSDPKVEYKVEGSFITIRDSVVDLWNPSSNLTEKLRIRTLKQKFFIENITVRALKSCTEANKAIDEGLQKLLKMATHMSRVGKYQRVLFVNVWRRGCSTPDSTPDWNHLSTASFYDLSSDRPGGGPRLKGAPLEARALRINLASLREIVGALIKRGKAKKSGGGKKVFLPWRNSPLTQCLRSAFEDPNHKLSIMVNVSPADVGYEKSLASIRFASRAHQIPLKVGNVTGEGLSGEYPRFHQAGGRGATEQENTA